jgi:hypothetical protein
MLTRAERAESVYSRREGMLVEADDRAIGPGQGGDDEAHPRKQLPEVMLYLGDRAPRPVLGGRLILEAPVADQWAVDVQSWAHF